MKTKIKNTENTDLKNQLARALADYANLKKRSDEERLLVFKLANIAFVTKILPVLDSLRQAQRHLKDTGIAIIVGQIESLLKESGFVEIVPNIGDIFDEQTSEVIEAVENQEKKDNNNSDRVGKISEVILSGWKFEDSIVRFAKVKVLK